MQPSISAHMHVDYIMSLISSVKLHLDAASIPCTHCASRVWLGMYNYLVLHGGLMLFMHAWYVHTIRDKYLDHNRAHTDAPAMYNILGTLEQNN